MEQIITTFISQGIFILLVGFLIKRSLDKMDGWIDKATTNLEKLTTMTAVHEVEIDIMKGDIAELKGDPKVSYRKKKTEK